MGRGGGRVHRPCTLLAVGLTILYLTIANVGHSAHDKLFGMHAENINYTFCVKGACSEICGKWIFFKLADMVTFPTNISSTVKKMQICISFASNLRKQCLCYLLFYKRWKPRLLISKPDFRWFFLNYTDFAHTISYTKPSKYDSTSGTKISICLKKFGGMRLLIRTSPFKA